ncbi:MAG TPA: glycosyltransferase family 2 protein [Actinomycetota bacterium]|jgi:glycosyltransferase involved in cell wall biosynthesis
MAGSPHPDLLTVIVPVFNERATVRQAIERLQKADLQLPLDIVIVDDGSTDGSAEEIADLVETGQIRLLRHSRNRGKGAAVKTGLAAASGQLTGILDADLEYDPNDYRLLLEPILAREARVAFGTRAFGAQTAFSFWYLIGGRFLSFVASLLFNGWLSDITTCLKVAPTALWRSLDPHTPGFAFDSEVTAKLLKAREKIFEVPISYRARTREQGKKLDWTDGLSSLWALLRVRFAGV